MIFLISAELVESVCKGAQPKAWWWGRPHHHVVGPKDLWPLRTGVNSGRMVLQGDQRRRNLILGRTVPPPALCRQVELGLTSCEGFADSIQANNSKSSVN